MTYELMWTEKYRPKSAEEIIGNEEAKADFIGWLTKKGKKKAALLYGPPGIGKTALVNAAANAFKFRVIEMNASDMRTEKAIMRIAVPSSTLTSIESFSHKVRGNLLLFDEVDGIFGTQDRGGVNAIIKLIEQTQVPIILTANDPDLQKLRPLKRMCHLIRFRPVRIPSIIAFLQKICKKEDVRADTEALEIIAEKSRGDVRSAVNDLQTLSTHRRELKAEDLTLLPTRNRVLNLQDTLEEIFSAENQEKALAAMRQSSIDYDALMLIINDNLPLRYRNFDDLSIAYNALSRADIYRGRIGVENWRLLNYVFGAMARSTTISPQSYRTFNPIYPPKRILAMFWGKSKRSMLEKICAKIGKKCRVSKKTAYFEFIPFIKAIAKKQTILESASWFEFEEKEIDFIKTLD